MTNPSVDDLTGAEARAILKRLWDEGGSSIQHMIRREIDIHLSDVVPDRVADAVLADLDGLTVEDLWDRSGSTTSGYVDPSEASAEMIREALEPHVRELDRYTRLGRGNESLLFCAGILAGIYEFGAESSTEFLKWAPDGPQDAFHWILGGWKRSVSSKGLRDRMSELLRAECPAWVVEDL